MYSLKRTDSEWSIRQKIIESSSSDKVKMKSYDQSALSLMKREDCPQLIQTHKLL